MENLEKLAEAVLKERPGCNVVYVTKDGQAFLNKDAANNHSSTRKIDAPVAFYRKGVPTPEEKEGNAVALTEALEAINDQEEVMEWVEKVLAEEDHGVEVTLDTDPLVALAVGVKDQLAEAKEALAAKEQELSDQLAEAKDALAVKEQELSDQLSKAKEALAAKDQQISELVKQIEVSAEKVAAAPKKK